MPTADQGIDDVYRSKPGEFVRTRNAVAARLRKAGRTDEAAQIDRLRRPTPALWAVNQISHETPDDVANLLKAVEGLQDAQIGARHNLAEARDRQRQALDGLLKRAGAILASAGLQPSPAVLGRVSATLLGAAVDPDGRAALRRGRLTEERSAPGFEAFALRRVPRDSGGAPKSEAHEKQPAPEPQHAKADFRARAEALEARRAVQREARAAERRATHLERQAAQRQHASDTTAKTIERLREQLRQAEARLAEERRAAEEATRFATRARQEAQRRAASSPRTEVSP